MTEEEFQDFLKAQNALRDILFVYKVCLEYRCLFEDLGTDAGTFDPFFYIDCSKANAGGMDRSDLQLLHEGSAVTLACEALQIMGQGDYGMATFTFTRNRFPNIAKIRTLVQSKRTEHLPKFKAFSSLFLQPLEAEWSWSQTWVDELMKLSNKLYEEYVFGYFRISSELETLKL